MVWTDSCSCSLLKKAEEETENAAIANRRVNLVLVESFSW